MSITKWILTVPHGKCDDVVDEGHPCDTVAMKAADMLADALDDLEQEVVIVHATTIREMGDLNRITTAGRTFHQIWEREVNETTRPCVVDVHSFDDLNWFGGTNVALLESTPTWNRWTKQLAVLSDAAHLQGKDENYIITHAVRDLGCPAILIEFWESLSVRKLEKAVVKIAEALVSLSHDKMIRIEK